MTTSTTASRKVRERQQRHDRILEAARDIAEQDGWDAVTTRRLADAIEHSQPVLYGHFPGGRAEIIDAVAVQGFAAMADALVARRAPASPQARIRRLVTAYLDFAGGHPALYDAMFALPIASRFASADTPPELVAAFDAIRDALLALPAPPQDLDVAAEVLWAAMHGLAALEASGRLPAAARKRRIEILTGLVARG